MADEYPNQNQIPYGSAQSIGSNVPGNAGQQSVEQARAEAYARQQAYREQMMAKQHAQQVAHVSNQPQRQAQQQPAYQPAPQPAIYTSQPAYDNMHGQHVAEQKPSLLWNILSFIVMMLVVFGAAILLRMFVIAPYEIPSGSMEPTIMIRDKVFSEKVSYYLGDVQPGQIVTFMDPEVPDRTLIKRCIAVGGQTVDLQDGFVYVDGQRLDEPYTQGAVSEPLVPATNVQISYPYMVPDGHIWVMGDNRTNSADSRYFGAIPTSSVTGHALCVYWPLNRIGSLG